MFITRNDGKRGRSLCKSKKIVAASRLLFLIVHAQPVAHPLPSLLESLMESWPLLRRQDCVDSVFPARENPSVSRRSSARKLVSSSSICCRIGRIFCAWSGVSFISDCQRSGVFEKKRRGSRFRRISSLADPMTKNAPVTAPATKVARTRKAIFHRLTPFMSTHNKDTPPKAIFFDAAGTLFHLPRGVGYHYALVGENIGLKLDSRQLDRAFNNAW